MEKLALILGRKPDTDIEELLREVERMKFELDAKMGYSSLSVIDKLKRDGLIRYSEHDLSWNLRMSDREMRSLLGEKY